MKNFILILALTLLIAPSLVSQEKAAIAENEAVVFLQDGSKIKGKVLDWQLNEFITLEMPWGKNITIHQEQIKNIIQEGTDINYSSPYNFNERGIYYGAKAQVIAGNEGERANGVFGFGFSASVGYRFNRLLGIGGGVGYDKYIWDSGEELFPIFAEIQGFVTPTNTSLFYNLQVGYSIAQTNNQYLLTHAKGGMMVYPSVGIRFGREATKMTLDVGYKFQNASFTYRDIWTATTSSEQDVLFKRLCFRIGVTL